MATSLELDFRPPPRTLRWFAAVIVVFSTVLAAWNAWFGKPWAIAAGAAVLIGAAGALRPTALRWPYVIASIMTFPIAWCTQHLILAVVFYGLFTPVAVAFRVFGRDRLGRRSQRLGWVRKELPSEPARYLQSF